MQKHIFDTDIAQLVGLNAAVLLENIAYWCNHNKANEVNFHDGHYWTFNSVKAFEELFPYLTANAIRTALNKLKDAGLILVGNYNKSAYDRTLWYALTEKAEIILGIKKDVSNDKQPSEPDTLDKTLYQAPESTTTAEPVCELVPAEPEPRKREEYPTAFEQLWAIYPKHVAKMAAYKAWRKAKVGMNSAFLLAKVQAFAAQCVNTETKYIPNFATWLNGERWNDEYRPDPPQARKPVTNAERNMQNLAQAMQSQTDLFGFQIESGVSRP